MDSFRHHRLLASVTGKAEHKLVSYKCVHLVKIVFSCPWASVTLKAQQIVRSEQFRTCYIYRESDLCPLHCKHMHVLHCDNKNHWVFFVILVPSRILWTISTKHRIWHYLVLLGIVDEIRNVLRRQRTLFKKEKPAINLVMSASCSFFVSNLRWTKGENSQNV